MPDETKVRRPHAQAERGERLADALRENLRRRKVQARARTRREHEPVQADAEHDGASKRERE